MTSFGCPRVGDIHFARLVDTDSGMASVRRVVQSFDIVARAPLQILGWRHFGHEYFLDVNTQKMYLCDDIAPSREQGGLKAVAWDESPSCVNNNRYKDLSIPAHLSYVFVCMFLCVFFFMERAAYKC